MRHAHLELAPELEPYWSRVDTTTTPAPSWRRCPATGTQPLQGFVALLGVIAVLDAVVAGSFAGLAALALDLGTAASLTLGTAAFLAAVISFVAYPFRTIASTAGRSSRVFSHSVGGRLGAESLRTIRLPCRLAGGARRPRRETIRGRRIGDNAT